MRLPETATVWKIEDNDGTGGKRFSDPVSISCRIAYRNEQTKDRNGNSFSSSAVFYTDSADVKPGVYVYFGASADIDPASVKSHEVRNVSRVPSGTELRKAWV